MRIVADVLRALNRTKVLFARSTRFCAVEVRPGLDGLRGSGSVPGPAVVCALLEQTQTDAFIPNAPRTLGQYRAQEKQQQVSGVTRHWEALLKDEILSMYRKHANSLRALAAEMEDQTRRESMLELAKAYDAIADRYGDKLKESR